MTRPEPISSITESASSETTSTLRSRYELRAAVNRRPCHTTVRTGPYTAVRELIPFLVDERREHQAIRSRHWKAQQRGLWRVRDTKGQVRCQRCYSPAFGSPEYQQSGSATTLGFPLPPQSSPKLQKHPTDKTKQHFGCFAKAEIASPAPQIQNQCSYRGFNAHTFGPACDSTNPLLKAF